MALKWEEIKCERMQKSFLSDRVPPMLRAKVPGAWFVRLDSGGIGAGGAFFYPDPEHQWDGSSLP